MLSRQLYTNAFAQAAYVAYLSVSISYIVRANANLTSVYSRLESKSGSRSIETLQLDSSTVSGETSYGIMFDIGTFENNVIIESIDFYVNMDSANEGTKVEVSEGRSSTTNNDEESCLAQVFTKEGSYRDSGAEYDSTEWQKVGEFTFDVRAPGIHLVKAPPLHYTVHIPQKSRQAFCIVTNRAFMVYSPSRSKVGMPVRANARMSVLVGSGVLKYPPFSDDHNSVVPRRAFDGNVHYSVLNENIADVPTQSPTTTRRTTVNAQILLRLYKANASRGRSLVKERHLQDEDANDDLKREDLEDISNDFLEAYFENEVLVPMDITDINATTPESVFVDPSTSITVSDAASDLHEDYYINVEGEYTPPPYIDFDEAIGDGFNNEGDVFVTQLRLKSDKFDEVTAVEAQTIKFEVLDDTIPERKYSIEAIGLVAGITLICACFIGGVAICLSWRRRRALEYEDEDEDKTTEGGRPGCRLDSEKSSPRWHNRRYTQNAEIDVSSRSHNSRYTEVAE